MPPEFIEFFAGQGFSEFFDSVFAFNCEEPLEVLFGFVSRLSTQFQQNVFDQQMSDTELLTLQVVSGFAEGEDVTILEQGELSGLDGIGDVFAGVTVVLEDPDFNLRVDIILFRRGEVGVIFMSMYPDGQEQLMDIVAAARLVGLRILDEFPPTSVVTSATPRPTISATTQVREIDGMVQVLVPAGEFLMGSAVGGESDERPQHTISLDAFWIDQTEVTNAMFSRFVSLTDYQTDAESSGGGWISANTFDNDANWRNPYGAGSVIVGLEDHPVVQVSWNDAAAYCDWAGSRLPTEAEWEKAARGPDGWTYPWGNQTGAGNLVNFADRNLVEAHADESVDDGFEFTARTGSYPAGASSYGALDMSGNVWEWVSDWYDEAYYENSPSDNPTGPSSGEMRVLRGGSYFQRMANVRAAERISANPDERWTYAGFRCARSP
jgi:formylglycine-generating enzyme required for sulfatase activity